jgi:hypothetical protein
MSYIFYKDLISEIAISLNYNAIVHLLARDYSDESVLKQVQSSNPFFVDIKDDKVKTKNTGKITLGKLREIGMLQQ